MYEPNFHDGLLQAIDTFDDVVKLRLKTELGGTFYLALSSVEALHATDFRLGNIVLDVRVVTGRVPDAGDLDGLYPPPHPAAVQKHRDSHGEYITQVEQRLKRGDISLLIVRSSYGCHLTAVCGAIAVSQ